ncbi:MAG: hypothetical protein BWZ07_03084 [Alphaproteobacteria bacterium ADurb.BinA280]|nr:MAG: hypothetical protein BWZ07_03084 [Alphaproteobacteria bacterium ADurb.BinA280]
MLYLPPRMSPGLGLQQYSIQALPLETLSCLTGQQSYRLLTDLR